MPFDGKVSDYFETKPAPVYDRDNPPPTMAEAIRMAVADVEAQERAGVEYQWSDCLRCTAGAVCRRIGLSDDWNYFKESSAWGVILRALSGLTIPAGRSGLRGAWQEWPSGFSRKQTDDVHITPFHENPTAFKRDMLALADRLEAEAV